MIDETVTLILDAQRRQVIANHIRDIRNYLDYDKLYGRYGIYVSTSDGNALIKALGELLGT